MLETFERMNFDGQIVPIWRLTRPTQKAFHRFFDTSPISPSGQHIAYLETSFDDHLPGPDDAAQVVVVDLAAGGEVYRSSTAAWDTQLGAQIQWGASDATLMFNRMNSDGAKAHGAIVNIFEGTEQTLDGQIYMVSPDGAQAASFRLEALPGLQGGYGVIVGPDHMPSWRGWPVDEGLWITNLDTGQVRLVLSLASIVAQTGETKLDLDPKRGYLAGFHVKWNPDSTRLLLLLRWRQDGKGHTRNFLYVCDADGSRLKLVLHARDWGFGHHPNWCPDSRQLVMNLGLGRDWGAWGRIDRIFAAAARRMGIRYFSASKMLRLAFLDTEKSEPSPRFVPLASGSGHPSVHPNGKFILTDAYPTEPVAKGNGTAPLRWIDCETGGEQVLAHVPVRPPHWVAGNAWRVDPHPVFDRYGTKVVFNAAPNGIRGVFLADISGLPGLSNMHV